MFGNKKKTDSKVRFQNRGFRRQLRKARNYKRPLRKLPETRWQLFLSKIGLGSWLSRILTSAVFFALVYVVFIPNVFFVKQISINGASQDVYGDIYNITNSYLSRETPWPQRNLLLLSESGLKSYLLGNDQKILNVTRISKKFPSALVIDVTARVNEFVVQTASSTNYALSSDGLVTGEIQTDASGTLPTGLILIKLTDDNNVSVGSNPLPKSSLDYISGIQGSLPGVAGSTVNYYEMSDLSSPDLDAYLKNGLLLKLSLSSDLNQTLGRLKLLLSQFSPAELRSLHYVDMRFADRAYVCYQGAPCAQNITVPQSSATSTASSTITGD